MVYIGRATNNSPRTKILLGWFFHIYIDAKPVSVWVKLIYTYKDTPEASIYSCSKGDWIHQLLKQGIFAGVNTRIYLFESGVLQFGGGMVVDLLTEVLVT